MSNEVLETRFEYSEDGMSYLKRGIMASFITAVMTIGIFTAMSFNKCNDSSCPIHHTNALVKMLK